MLKTLNTYFNLNLFIITFVTFFMNNISFSMWFVNVGEKGFGYAKEWQTGFQYPVTEFMEGLVFFHSELMAVLAGIAVFVGYLLIAIFFRWNVNYNANKASLPFKHEFVIEVVWTIVPILILASIMIPSFVLLYKLDRPLTPEVTVRVIGHQWYWTYEYKDTKELFCLLEDYLINQNKISISTLDSAFTESFKQFDSFLVDNADLGGDSPQGPHIGRLTVDRALVLPARRNIRVVVGSADVLHSWSVPAFGVKVDACPGRINQMDFSVRWPGRYFGQCSEICGYEHGFMPIGIEVMSSITNADIIAQVDLNNIEEPIIQALIATANDATGRLMIK